MVFPRFVTETTPMERDRDVRDGPSNWPGGQAGPVKFGRPKTPFWNWWNNWKSSQKGGPVEFKGGGKATGGAKRASRCWRCWFESQALWLQVVRVKEFWMPLGRLVLGVVPILGPKMGSIFCEDSMPRVCKSVASYLCLFLPCIRFFFDFSAYFWGMQTGSHKEVPVRNDGGASKMYLLLSNCTGGSLINYPPPRWIPDKKTASTLVPWLARDDGLTLEVVGIWLPRERHDVSGKCVVYIF